MIILGVLAIIIVIIFIFALTKAAGNMDRLEEKHNKK
jgi:hypothetical protein